MLPPLASIKSTPGIRLRLLRTFVPATAQCQEQMHNICESTTTIERPVMRNKYDTYLAFIHCAGQKHC